MLLEHTNKDKNTGDCFALDCGVKFTDYILWTTEQILSAARAVRMIQNSNYSRTQAGCILSVLQQRAPSEWKSTCPKISLRSIIESRLWIVSLWNGSPAEIISYYYPKARWHYDPYIILWFWLHSKSMQYSRVSNHLTWYKSHQGKVKQSETSRPRFKCFRRKSITLNSQNAKWRYELEWWLRTGLHINAYKLCTGEVQIVSLFFIGIAYPNDMETSLRLSSPTSATSCTSSTYFHHSLSNHDKRWLQTCLLRKWSV